MAHSLTRLIDCHVLKDKPITIMVNFLCLDIKTPNMNHVDVLAMKFIIAPFVDNDGYWSLYMIMNPGAIRNSITLYENPNSYGYRLNMFGNNLAPVIFYLDGNIKNNNKELSATPPHHERIMEWLESCTTDSDSFKEIQGYDAEEEYFTNPDIDYIKKVFPIIKFNGKLNIFIISFMLKQN